ncbi:MAG: tRNA pseudouridine(55) synthase TruB [Gammaproteobacteria bacterium]|nr:tRNA pseudouridine(55) synthase TruB [Gammaproteobacteria bacterium]
MGRKPRKGRRVNGILLLDKPAGMTSNGALQKAKKIFEAAKAGHTGSLDPLATGVLPICFGEATKFSQFLLDANKRYLTTVKLGVVTATGDADGKILSIADDVPEISKDHLEAVLDGFRGVISQVPSMYSALKVDGQPLYKLARQGIEVERKSRQVTIFKMEVVSHGRDEIVLDIVCSKGTYVRCLAEEIGQVFGCGAHVVALRRLEVGPFDIDETYSMEKLERLRELDGLQALDEKLLPSSAAVINWPSVQLTAVTASYLRQGQPVQTSNAPTEGWVRIFSESDGSGQESVGGNDDESFIGVGEILEDGRIAPRRLVVMD